MNIPEIAEFPENYVIVSESETTNMKKSFFYALTAVMIWSTLAPVVKMTLSVIPNLEALAVSGFSAFIFLFIWNLRSGICKKMHGLTRKDYGIMVGLGFVGLFLYSVFYYYGLSQLSAQKACILNYLWPAMLVVFSCIILKEKITLLKVIAIICSFVGVVILSMGEKSAGRGAEGLGIISCIAAATCYGFFSAINKKVKYDIHISMMIMWLTVAISSTLAGLLTETWVPVSKAQWLGILWTGFAVDAIAYLFWAIALQKTENTAVIANIAYFTPFLSLVVSHILLKEQIRIQSFLALLLIIGGNLLQNLPVVSCRKGKCN